MHIQTERILPQGAMVGETDLVMKRRRQESFKAIDDAFVLKMEAVDFNDMMA